MVEVAFGQGCQAQKDTQWRIVGVLGEASHNKLSHRSLAAVVARVRASPYVAGSAYQGPDDDG
jgi:hypothetical protein